MSELLDLAATWDRASARRLASANRLGNCRAGEVAAAEAGILRDCAAQLRATVISALTPEPDDTACGQADETREDETR